MHFVAINAGNVGAARAVGFSYARTQSEQGALDDSRIWYVITDADSVVDSDWLLRQTGVGTDMVLGVVRIATSRHFPAAAVRRYLAGYRSKVTPTVTGTCAGRTSGFAPTHIGSTRIRRARQRRRR